MPNMLVGGGCISINVLGDQNAEFKIVREGELNVLRIHN